MSFSRILTLAGLALTPVLAASAASAAAYVENISANPASLTCVTASGHETCSGYASLYLPADPGATGTWLGGSGVVILHDNDTMTINLSYTSPLHVPNSAVESAAYVTLYDWNGIVSSQPTGGSTTTSTLANYVGPASPGTSYSSINYTAAGGYGPGLGGSQGPFSITGMNSVITITHGDPYEIISVAYGYQFAVPELATWSLIIVGIGAAGGMLRARRRAGIVAA